MSVSSFVPTIWSASILRGFEKASVFTSCLSRQYEGELKNVGDTVRVPSVGAVQVRDYQKGTPISYDEVAGSTKDICVDECKYWALKTEDIDKLQAAPNFLDAAVKDAAYALRDTIDKYSAEVLTQGAGTKLFETTPYDIATKDIIGLFATFAQELDERNIPRAGRFCIIPPYGVRQLTLTIIDTETPNTAPISEGYISRVGGFDIYMSNNLTLDSSNNATVIAGIQTAGTHIVQISKTESIRDQNQFGDLIRGLALYKTAVLLPEAVLTAKIKRPAV